MILVCRMLLPLSGANGGTGSQFPGLLYASSIASAFFSIIVAFMFGGTFPVGVFITIVAFGSFPIKFATFIEEFAADAAAN